VYSNITLFPTNGTTQLEDDILISTASMVIRVRPIRTSDIGNIGAKLNIEKSVASVRRYGC